MNGDSVTWARNGQTGPHLATLIDTLNRYVPEGGTPISSTLQNLVPPLSGLNGATTVVLATDGAPNCNAAITCDSAHCIPDIESVVPAPGVVCGSTVNCCAPELFGTENCIDDDASVTPIEALFERGIKTYVIGLPGSEAYQSVLNRFATAGGTARTQTLSTDPLYYPVADVAELTQALKGIAVAISISCTVKLERAPDDWSYVNVYFDNKLLAMDPDHGWRQVDSDTLEIVGTSCSDLLSGDVFQVQITVGCKTGTLI
jgi:hypothetical protein